MKKLLVLVLPLLLWSQDVELATKMITEHEGFRSTPYKDNGGLSIGYGTRLPLTKGEAEYLLSYRLNLVHHKLARHTWYYDQPYIIRSILLDMTYNLGSRGILRFKKMIYQLKRKNYVKASIEMENSLWYRQTGNRAKYLVTLMRNYKEIK